MENPSQAKQRALVAAAAVLALLAAGCSARAGTTEGLADIRKVPHTTTGALLMAPPRDAVDVDPSQPVVVQTRFSDARLQGVTVTQEGGPFITGSLTPAQFIAERALLPDATYTVTAVVTVPADSGGSGAVSTQTETARFATARTPRIVGVTPTVVAAGKPATISFDSRAREVKVDGPVTFQISAEGNAVSVYPTSYHQGATFSVSVTATSMKGTVGQPQAARFMAQGGPTLSLSPGDGSPNMGVAIPLTVTLTEPPANPADFAGHFRVTADVTSTATPIPVDPGTMPGSQKPNPCFQYAPPAVTGTLVVGTNWASPTRLQILPKTPDGYWPGDVTITVSAELDGLSARNGSWFAQNVNRTFVTGDKRVIDVDLSSQTVSACRNGALDRQFPVSTGTRGKETPTGTFAIYQRIQDAEMKSSESQFAPDYYDVKHVPWTQYFSNGVALHGAWWHNNFGHPMSHGCVNVSTPTNNTSWPNAAANAEYLWHFDNLGDPVIVHGSTP